MYYDNGSNFKSLFSERIPVGLKQCFYEKIFITLVIENLIVMTMPNRWNLIYFQWHFSASLEKILFNYVNKNQIPALFFTPNLEKSGGHNNTISNISTTLGFFMTVRDLWNLLFIRYLYPLILVTDLHKNNLKLE